MRTENRTAQTIAEAARSAGHVTRRGTIRVLREIAVREIARTALIGLIPEGTLQWLAEPDRRESISSYARRAYEVAAMRSAWAGGLRDGTYLPDATAIQSADWIARR